MPKPTVFLSYSHRDEDWKVKLRSHLKVLENVGTVVVWDDRKIDAGDTWYEPLRAAIDSADATICLISADYLASDFCVKEEIPYLLKRRGEKGMLIVPVLLRPCPWKYVPWLKSLQMLPRDGRSVAVDYATNWDLAFGEVADFIADPASYRRHEDEPQLILRIEEGKIVLRFGKVLGDYVQRSDTGLFVPQRVILTQFKEQFGAFTLDEIMELESLLNSTTAREIDYQRYFERYPQFFQRWGYREVFPQVYLTRRDAGPLKPDFILANKDAQKAAIVELKLPGPKVVRQMNRDRFGAVLYAARTQLLRYRDWFRDAEHRKMLKAKIGMEIYEPHLAVVLGRSSEFQDEVDRQRLAADNPDIEIVTYDDMLAFAKDKRI